MPSLADLSGKSLQSFLRSRSSGNVGRVRADADPDLLGQLQAYDPSARIVQESSGGEGGGTDSYIYYDESKLPAFKGRFDTARAVGTDEHERSMVRNPKAVQHDDVYGDWTTGENMRPEKDAAWVKYAPLVVGMLAPMAGAALAGAGIGGAAGLTSAVTSGAAGGVTGGLAGAGASATQIPSWLASQLAKAPQYARQFDSGQGFNLQSLFGAALGAGGNALGVPSGVTSTGMTLARLAGRH